MNETDSQSTLSIYNTEDIDDGSYTCIAENAAGRAESLFTLTILGRYILLNESLTYERFFSFLAPPNIFSPVATHTTLTVKFPTTQIILLRCISTGSPLPTVSWYKYIENRISCEGVVGDGFTMDEVFPPPNTDLLERCSIQSLPGYAALDIYNPRVEDEGTYTCVAENSVASSEAYISLHVEGNFIQIPLSEKVYVTIFSILT